MKGFLKGFKYISQIFEAKEEEEEEEDEQMVIGFPTDVKHVAHIGSDGPSSGTTPSWMNEFKNASGPLPPTAAERELAGKRPEPQLDSQTLREAESESVRGPLRPPRHARRSSGGAWTDSPPHEPADPQKPQRSRNSGGTSSSSTNHEAGEGSTRSRRRASQELNEVESLSRDMPGVPRQSRHQRRSRGSLGGSGGGGSGGSTTSRASRSKVSTAMTEIITNNASDDQSHADERSISQTTNSETRFAFKEESTGRQCTVQIEFMD